MISRAPCIVVQAGETFTLTIRNPQTVDGPAIGVSYDAFVDDVQVGTHNAASELAVTVCPCTALLGRGLYEALTPPLDVIFAVAFSHLPGSDQCWP